MEDPHHVLLHHLRSPPRLTPPAATPEPRWKDLPPQRREELLRLLGRMLEERLALAGPRGEVTHERP